MLNKLKKETPTRNHYVGETMTSPGENIKDKLSRRYSPNKSIDSNNHKTYVKRIGKYIDLPRNEIILSV